jgi:acyl-CoA thioester hydrolase
MSNTSAVTPAIFREEFVVPASAIDANGHVNNVVFVQWMQDVATRHFDSMGCAEAMREARAIWVVRSHTIEYLAPCLCWRPIASRHMGGELQPRAFAPSL